MIENNAKDPDHGKSRVDVDPSDPENFEALILISQVDLIEKYLIIK